MQQERDPDGCSKEKRRARQLRYYHQGGGWARRRERDLARQLIRLTEEAEQIGFTRTHEK